MSYYAVAVGRQVGVFTQPWSVVCKYVTGYSGAVYKKFSSRSDAQEFVRKNTPTIEGHEAQAQEAHDPEGGKRRTHETASRDESAASRGLHLYTDGGFRRGVSAAAVVAVLDGDEVYRKGKLVPDGTNNRGELVAIRMAFQFLSKLSEEQFMGGMTIHPDSEYAINVITGKKKAKANLDLVLPLKEWYSDAQPYLKFLHIDAHSGHRWNEEADAICTKLILDELERHGEQ
jgi:ribonuclease HI